MLPNVNSFIWQFITIFYVIMQHMQKFAGWPVTYLEYSMFVFLTQSVLERCPLPRISPTLILFLQSTLSVKVLSDPV